MRYALHRAIDRRVFARDASVVLSLTFALSPAHSQQSSPATTATVVGVVYDSVRAAPLANATVQLMSRTNPAATFSVQADSAGSFSIPKVPRGQYFIGFLDPELSELDLSSVQRGLSVDSEPVVHVSLSVPAAIAIRTVLCGAPELEDSSGMLVGFVRDADTGFPIGGAHVLSSWREVTIDKQGLHREHREVPATADSTGWFAICGLPTDGAIDVRAELGARSTSFIEVNVPPRGLLIRDLNLGSDTVAVAALPSVAVPSSATAPTSVAARRSAVAPASAVAPVGEQVRHGTARMVGLVRDPTGKRLQGAHLTVWGTGVTGVSGEGGRFALASLPSGTQTLEAQYLGFAPLYMSVDLASGRTDTVEVKLAKQVQVLSRVNVYGKTTLTNLDAFLSRRQLGLGQFITADDIANRRPRKVTDLFNAVPNVRVVRVAPRDSDFELGITTNRANETCFPALYIDGALVRDGARNLNDFVGPQDISGIEIYADAATVPTQYRTGNCGAVLIWTR